MPIVRIIMWGSSTYRELLFVFHILSFHSSFQTHTAHCCTRIWLQTHTAALQVASVDGNAAPEDGAEASEGRRPRPVELLIYDLAGNSVYDSIRRNLVGCYVARCLWKTPFAFDIIRGKVSHGSLIISEHVVTFRRASSEIEHVLWNLMNKSEIFAENSFRNTVVSRNKWCCFSVVRYIMGLSTWGGAHITCFPFQVRFSKFLVPYDAQNGLLLLFSSSMTLYVGVHEQLGGLYDSILTLSARKFWKYSQPLLRSKMA